MYTPIEQMQIARALEGDMMTNMIPMSRAEMAAVDHEKYLQRSCCYHVDDTMDPRGQQRVGISGVHSIRRNSTEKSDNLGHDESDKVFQKKLPRI